MRTSETVSRRLRTLAFYIPASTVALMALVTMLRQTMTFDADGLWLFSFLHDMRVGTPIGSWMLPGAPLYFPELLSVFTWTSLHLSPGGTMLAHGLLSWLLVYAAIAWAGRLAGSSWPFALEAAFLALLLYIFCFHDSHLIAAFQFPVAHGGSTLACLLGLIFLGKGLLDGHRWQTATLAAGCLALIVASDRAALSQFVAPVVLSASILLVLRRIGWRALLCTVVTVVSGAALGWLLTHLLATTASIQPAPLGINPSWTAASETFSLIAEDLLALAQQQPMVLALVVLPIGVLSFVTVEGLIRHRKISSTGLIDDRGSLFVFWLALACLITIAATLAGPVLTHRWAPRYILPFFVLPLGLSISAMSPRLEAYNSRALRPLQAGLLVVLAVLASDPADTMSPLNPYAPAHACLDRLAHQHKLSAGYSSYWHARPLMVMGHNHLTISGVSGPLALRRWMDNAFWYSRGYDPSTARPPRFDFVIINDLDTAWLRTRFGAPRAREQCFGPETWIYDRETDIEFRNFNRTRVARETGDHDSWWESPTLRRARLESPGLLAFEGGEGVLIEFPGAPGANTLEISCPTQQPLEVRYQLDGREIARQAVDSRIDTRRIVSMPEPVIRNGFNSIRLHGLAGVRYEIADVAVMVDAPARKTRD